MNHYNCRGQDGALKLVLPEQSRRRLFCPGCTYTYQGTGCLFAKNQPEPKRAPQRAAAKSPRTTKVTRTQVIEHIKKRWLELGRVPRLKDFPHPYGTLARTTLHHLPGGFQHALRIAAAELGLTLTYKCECCDREFKGAQGLAMHQRFCTVKEEED